MAMRGLLSGRAARSGSAARQRRVLGVVAVSTAGGACCLSGSEARHWPAPSPAPGPVWVPALRHRALQLRRLLPRSVRQAQWPACIAAQAGCPGDGFFRSARSRPVFVQSASASVAKVARLPGLAPATAAFRARRSLHRWRAERPPSRPRPSQPPLLQLRLSRRSAPSLRPPAWRRADNRAFQYLFHVVGISAEDRHHRCNTVKPLPSKAPSNIGPAPSFQDSAGRIRSASRSRMSIRTARRPSMRKPASL